MLFRFAECYNVFFVWLHVTMFFSVWLYITVCLWLARGSNILLLAGCSCVFFILACFFLLAECSSVSSAGWNVAFIFS